MAEFLNHEPSAPWTISSDNRCRPRLGRAIAVRLATEGAIAILVGRGADALEETASEIRQAAGEAKGCRRGSHRPGRDAAVDEQWAGIVGADIANWRHAFEVNLLLRCSSGAMTAGQWAVAMTMVSGLATE